MEAPLKIELFCNLIKEKEKNEFKIVNLQRKCVFR